MSAQPSESAIYDGRRLLGSLKALVGGSFEVFVSDDAGGLRYLAKAQTRIEAVSLVHAAHPWRARPGGVLHVKQAGGADVAAA